MVDVEGGGAEAWQVGGAVGEGEAVEALGVDGVAVCGGTAEVGGAAAVEVGTVAVVGSGAGCSGTAEIGGAAAVGVSTVAVVVGVGEGAGRGAEAMVKTVDCDVAAVVPDPPPPDGVVTVGRTWGLVQTTYCDRQKAPVPGQ